MQGRLCQSLLYNVCVFPARARKSCSAYTLNSRKNGLCRVHFCYFLDVIGGKMRIRRKAQLLISVGEPWEGICRVETFVSGVGGS